MHLPVHLVSPVRRLGSQLNWEFFLDPGTTCLCHLLPGSGTKWAHFTLRWMCSIWWSNSLRFKPHLHFFSEIQVGTLPGTEIFFFLLKSIIHSSDNLLLRRQTLFYNPNKFARPVLEVGLFIFVLFSRSVVFTWLQTHVDLCSFLLTIIFLFDTIPYLRLSGKTATYRYSMYYY